LLHTLLYLVSFLLFFFTTPPTPELYTLSLHDALPIYQQHFDLLGISPTVSATSNILALVEHEVPEHELIHLLELRKENLEIVEVQIDKDSPSAGKAIEGLGLPEGAQLISVMRNGQAQIAT